MAKLRVHSFTVSLDGLGAGEEQNLEAPVERGGSQLHDWIFTTSGGQEMIGGSGGSTGVDDELFRARGVGSGATIIGRNMFGPLRGPWLNEDWQVSAGVLGREPSKSRSPLPSSTGAMTR